MTKPVRKGTFTFLNLTVILFPLLINSLSIALSLKSVQTTVSWATRGTLSLLLLSTFILVEIICKFIKSSCYLILELGRATWQRGGMVTQRIANPIHYYIYLHYFLIMRVFTFNIDFKAFMGHSWATLSFETVESSFYPQSPIKVSYETSLVPSEHASAFGLRSRVQ